MSARAVNFYLDTLYSAFGRLDLAALEAVILRHLVTEEEVGNYPS